MFLVVCYDIVEDRRRARLFRQMKDFLPRVQKSVFEGPLSDARYYILLTIIKKEIDHQPIPFVFINCAPDAFIPLISLARVLGSTQNRETLLSKLHRVFPT